MNKNKKFISILLVVCMLMSLFPGLGINVTFAYTATEDTYVPLKVTGFNKDVVVEKEVTISSGTAISSDKATPFDGENDGAYWALYETRGDNTGLPVSQSIGGGKFTLESYNAANSLQIDANSTTGSLTFVNHIGYPQIAFLGAGGNGETHFNAVITYTDGTQSDSLTAKAPDWYLGEYNGFKDGPFGRIKIQTTTTDSNTENAGTIQTGSGPNLYAFTITTNQNKAIQSIDFTFVDGNTKATNERLNIMAVSGVIPANTYSVTFDANNGGSGTMVTVTGLKSGDSYTLPANGFTPKDGYTFLGWSTTPGGGIISVNTIDITQNTTLYAKWRVDESGSTQPPEGDNYVAQIGTTGYETLKAAINAAVSSNTVTLLKDVEADATLGENVTLDLNGKILKGTIVGTFAMNGGTYITSDDYTIAGPVDSGAAYITSDSVFVVDNRGNITIKSGVVTLGQDMYTEKGQTLTVANDAEFIVPSGKTLLVRSNVVVVGTLTINGSVVLADTAASIKAATELTIGAGDDIDGYAVEYVGGEYVVVAKHVIVDLSEEIPDLITTTGTVINFNVPKDDGYIYLTEYIPSKYVKPDEYIAKVMARTTGQTLVVDATSITMASANEKAIADEHKSNDALYVTNTELCTIPSYNLSNLNGKGSVKCIAIVYKLHPTNMTWTDYGSYSNNPYWYVNDIEFDSHELDRTYLYAIYGVYAKEVTLDGGESETPVTPPYYGGDVYIPPTVDVPVSNNDTSVDVSATVSGQDATIAPLSNKQIEQLVGDTETAGDVVIDLTGLGKNIDTAGIPKKSLAAIVDAAEKVGNDTEHLVIKLSTAELKLDDTALRAIVDQADGDVVKFNFEDVGLGRLNKEQKEAVKDMDIRKGYEAYITVNGDRVSDFKGGKVEILVPYAVPAGENVAGFSVWYIDEQGNLEKQQSTYDGKHKCFVVKHFSDYVIAYSEADAQANDYSTCPRDNTCPIWPYVDAGVDAWYHDGVHYCIDNGLMVGVANNKFAPDMTTSRAMIATILWRMEGEPVVNYSMTFKDVEQDMWYSDAIRWAQSVNVVSGYSKDAFGPNDSITREQMAAFLWRYCQYKGIDVSVGEDTNILSYEDAFDVSDWAMPAMQWACGSGTIGGVAKNDTMYLDPQGDAVRSQSATMLYRFCTEIVK